MPKVNRTKYAILGMLNVEPMSGYEMKKRFDRSIAHFWNENYGHIYPVLKRLESEGHVTKETETTEGNPPRNVFTITEKGRGELRTWLLLPAERPILRIELLLKLFFGREAPLENMIEKVKQEKAFCEKTLTVFSEIEQHARSLDLGGSASEVPFWLITLRYGQSYYRAIASWCDDTLSLLQEYGTDSHKKNGEHTG
jgi:DNA-binding PadR family transcriptional regulator